MKNQKKSLNLIRVFGLKEVKHWKRTWTMRKKLPWVGFGIALILITVGHYAFALMHFLWESSLYIGGKLVDLVNKIRKEKIDNQLALMYKANIRKLQSQVT